MKSKIEALEYVEKIGKNNILSRSELTGAYDRGANLVVENETSEPVRRKPNIAEIISYIGGAIVFVGVAILVGQNWDSMDFIAKVLATLGIGAIAYLAGFVFSKNKKADMIGSVFYFISAMVSPIGFFVLFDEFGLDIGTHSSQALISAILLIAYIASYFLVKKKIFVLLSIFFGSWLFFAVTDLLISVHYDNVYEFSFYRTLIVGVSHVLIGYSFVKGKLSSLTNVLYGFGVFGVLWSALMLGKWSPEQNLFWELIYPFLILGSLYLSVYLKSGPFLIWGSIFLMAYILKITSEYFTVGLGWPLSLMIAGLSMIGVGYMAMSLKNRYLKK